MSNPFVAEIRIFPGNFAPVGWALCNGQVLPISQNTALFSLLGTTYGGDGRSNFALPNLQGRAPMHPGQGPGLSLHDLGESSGAEIVTLIVNELPIHTHAKSPLTSRNAAGNAKTPAGNIPAQDAASVTATYVDDAAPQGLMAAQSTSSTGGAQAHNNMRPYLTLNFIIALQGIFPSRN